MKSNKFKIYRTIRGDSLTEQSIRFKLKSNNNDDDKWIEKRFDLALEHFFEKGAKEFNICTILCEGQEYFLDPRIEDGYSDLLKTSIELWKTIKDPFAILSCKWCFLMEESSSSYPPRNEYVFFLVHQWRVVCECVSLRVSDLPTLEKFFHEPDNKHAETGLYSKRFLTAETKLLYRKFSDETYFGKVLKIMENDGFSPITYSVRELLKVPVGPTDRIFKMILFVLVLILLVIVIR